MLVGEIGSRENPLIIEAGETACYSYHVWRQEPIFFRIRFQNGRLSQPIRFSDPSLNGEEEISTRCLCCGEEIKSTLKFV